LSSDRSRVENRVASLEQCHVRTCCTHHTRRVVSEHFPLLGSGAGSLAHLGVDGIDRHSLDLHQQIAPLRIWRWQVCVDESIFIFNRQRPLIGNCAHRFVLPSSSFNLWTCDNSSVANHKNRKPHASLSSSMPYAGVQSGFASNVSISDDHWKRLRIHNAPESA